MPFGEHIQNLSHGISTTGVAAVPSILTKGLLVDTLPALKVQGFWDQTATAVSDRLTSPNPTIDAPTV